MTSFTSVRRSALVAVMALIAVLIPLTQLASANHGNRTLDANPEEQSREVGTEASITATVSSAADFNSGAINIDFENESGVNDTDGTTRATPDRQCTIAAGDTSCSITYVGNVPGTDTWRVWIDHDGLNGGQGGATEADDTEQRNENALPSGRGNGGTDCPGAETLPTEPERDCTDVVEVEWTNTQAPPVPTTLDCDDSDGDDRERETNPSGAGPQSNETYTCVVKDQYGNPARDADPSQTGNQAITVNGENETGVNDPDVDEGSPSYGTPDYSCQLPTATNGNGTCQITVTQAENETGTATICFWVGNGDDGAALCADEPIGPTGEDTGDDLADRVELRWVEREASGLDLEPENQTMNVGGTRTITARVYDQFGRPFQGFTQVSFEFFQNSPTDRTHEEGDGNSPDSTDASCTTTNDSTCTFEYTSEAAGRDLICGWVGTSPVMAGSGRNAAGTCGGEGRDDADDTPDEEDPADPAGDRIDLVETTWTNDPPATQLDCSNELGASLVGTSRKITCTATTDEPNSKVPNTEVDFELTGANDPDNGNTRVSPDMVCTTNEEGVCSVTHGPGNETNNVGKTNYTAWIDADYEDSTTEADPDEGRREGKAPGANTEPDNTDVVTHRWRSGDRTVTFKISDKWIHKGDRIFIDAKIRGEASACERNQEAVLKQRPADSSGGFWGRKTRVSDDNGNINFGGLRVWKDLDFKVKVKPAGPCKKAVSDVQTVHAK